MCDPGRPLGSHRLHTTDIRNFNKGGIRKRKQKQQIKIYLINSLLKKNARSFYDRTNIIRIFLPNFFKNVFVKAIKLSLIIYANIYMHLY